MQQRDPVAEAKAAVQLSDTASWAADVLNNAHERAKTPAKERCAEADARAAKAQEELAREMRRRGASTDMYLAQLHEIEIVALVDTLLPQESDARARFFNALADRAEAVVEQIRKPRFVGGLDAIT